jgi:hypothetical protein
MPPAIPQAEVLIQLFLARGGLSLWCTAVLRNIETAPGSKRPFLFYRLLLGRTRDVDHRRLAPHVASVCFHTREQFCGISSRVSLRHQLENRMSDDASRRGPSDTPPCTENGTRWKANKSTNGTSRAVPVGLWERIKILSSRFPRPGIGSLGVTDTFSFRKSLRR